MRVIRVIVTGALVSGSAWGAAPAKQTPPSGPEPDLFTAKKVFIANLGANDSKSLLGGTFSLGVNQPYNYFYAAVQSWGHYQVVPAPAAADLVLEVLYRDAVEYVPPKSIFRHAHSDPNDQSGQFIHHPALDLTVRDPKTQHVVKSFSESVEVAILHSHQETNFAQAITALVNDMAKMIDQPLDDFSLPKKIPMAPVPEQILTAKRLLISKAPEDPVHGEPALDAHVYQQVYEGTKNWGQYELVSAAADADLIWEPSLYDREPKLTIRDPHTQVVLWTVKQDVPMRSSLDEAWVLLLNSTSKLSGKPAFGAGSAPDQVISPLATVPLPVSITIPQSTVKTGARVQLNLTLKNVTDFDLDFNYPSGDPLTCVVVVRDAGGTTVAETQRGQQLRVQHASWQGPAVRYRLDPGERQARDCAVSELYDMTSPGKYFIEVRQIDGRAVHSNVVTVTVTP